MTHRRTVMRKFVYVEGDLVVGDPYSVAADEPYSHTALLSAVDRPAAAIDYSRATLGWLLVTGRAMTVRFGQTGASDALRFEVVTAISERFSELHVTDDSPGGACK